MDAREMEVWSRLLGGSSEGDFPMALLWEAEALARELKELGLPAPYRRQRQAVRLLRGIASLEGAAVAPGKPRPRPRGRRKERLTACFHALRRLMGEAAARSGRRETGLLYQQVEQLCREQCLLLAGELGIGR